jgi:hypothetical protein
MNPIGQSTSIVRLLVERLTPLRVVEVPLRQRTTMGLLVGKPAPPAKIAVTTSPQGCAAVHDMPLPVADT